MKRRFLIKSSVVFACFVIAGFLAYRQYTLTIRLNNALSFENTGVDKCLVGLVFYGSTMTDIEQNTANEVADELVATVRKYQKGISDDLFEFGPTYKMVFKSKNSTWQFEFAAAPDDPALVAYKTKKPSHIGTIFLDKRGGSELVTLIESLIPQDPNTNNSE